MSDDPLRNFKYLFVASTTLATRFAIEGGVDGETAYNASDLYIQQADRCGSIDDLKSLQTEMFEYFTKKSAAAKKKNIYSAHVTAAIEYLRTSPRDRPDEGSRGDDGTQRELPVHAV